MQGKTARLSRSFFPQAIKLLNSLYQHNMLACQVCWSPEHTQTHTVWTFIFRTHSFWNADIIQCLHFLVHCANTVKTTSSIYYLRTIGLMDHMDHRYSFVCLCYQLCLPLLSYIHLVCLWCLLVRVLSVSFMFVRRAWRKTMWSEWQHSLWLKSHQ